VRLSILATPSTPPQDCRACARTSPATFLYREACWIGCKSRAMCKWRNWETSRYGARLSGWTCAPCSNGQHRSKTVPRICREKTDFHITTVKCFGCPQMAKVRRLHSSYSVRLGHKLRIRYSGYNNIFQILIVNICHCNTCFRHIAAICISTNHL
jgi:hypothetical protein